MNHSKGPCGDATSSDMRCSSDFLGADDESFERVLRRCDVVRHAMLFRFCWGGFTMNHSKGSCGDAMSSHMPCAQDFRGFTLNHSKGSCGDARGFTMSHSKGPCGDAMSSDMLCFSRFKMNHSKGFCDDAMSSNMLCSSDFAGLR